MTNLHGLWMNCLHCPVIFVLGVGIVVVSCAAMLVSAAALCCKGQPEPAKTQPETQRSASDCDPDVLHVVF